MIFLAFLGPNELSVIETCRYYRGARTERFDCNDYFGRTLSVGRALFWAPQHNVQAWVKLYSYPLPTPPPSCLPSAPQQAANGRFIQGIKTSIIFALIDIFCIYKDVYLSKSLL